MRESKKGGRMGIDCEKRGEEDTKTLGCAKHAQKDREGRARSRTEICKLTHIPTPRWGGEKHTQHLPA